jgi:hypothetical protein
MMPLPRTNMLVQLVMNDMKVNIAIVDIDGFVPQDAKNTN